MKNLSAWDAVAIDTNVFEHISNPDRNLSCHISKVLKFLQGRRTKLLVDTKSKIFNEYKPIVDRLLYNSEILNETSFLRYWLVHPETRIEVDVDEQDALMAAISDVMYETGARKDRIFVYVAFCQGKNLISNDDYHIVIGPVREQGMDDRRHRLKRRTRKICRASQQSLILTSIEAHSELLS